MFLVPLHHHHLLHLHILLLLLLHLLDLLHFLHLHPLLLFHIRLHHHHQHHHNHHHHHHFRNGWQTPGPPPHLSAHRPSSLTLVACRSSVRIALNFLTPPGLPSQKIFGHGQCLLRLGLQVSCYFIQLNGIYWWMTDYRYTSCIHALCSLKSW